jgi:hypothetical protein
MSPTRGSLTLAAFAIAMICIAACDQAPPTATIPEPMPEANSPENTLRLLAWSYNHRDLDTYRTLFTADYRRIHTNLDSSGAGYRAIPWTRDDEIASAERIFRSASSIDFRLGPNFQVQADARPGKNARWHKVISTSFSLRIVMNQVPIESSALLRFFFVRGDSALIPDDVPLLPDSARWFIDRWEDQSASGSTTAVHGSVARPYGQQRRVASARTAAISPLKRAAPCR